MRTRCDQVDLNSTIAVTLILRASRRAQEYGAQLLSGDTTPLSRDEAEEITSADPRDRQAVLGFITSKGLLIASENARSRTICVTGTISQIDAAFGVTMRREGASAGHNQLRYDGQITLPLALQPIVEAVLGLDGRPVAHSRLVGTSHRNC